MRLHYFQTVAVRRTLDALSARPILVSPTGSGKTVMGVDIIRRRAVPTLWLAHRKELIEQAARRLAACGIMAGVIMPGHPPQPLCSVQVASIHTLANREKPPASLVIIDEAHHATADSYRDVLAAYPTADVLGLTATPFRLDGRGLGDLFQTIIVAAYADDLIRAGLLTMPKVYATTTPDLGGIRVTMGDYAPGALADRMNADANNADVVKTWRRLADGRRTVAFAVDVDHSRAIVSAFQADGIYAEHIDGKTPTKERDAILARLRAGETPIVSNCMVLTEGWDLPSLECAIIARPTASLNLHLQMIGRVVRAAEGKTAVILDHAGNHHMHGMFTRRLTYSLDGGRKAGQGEPLGLRRCEACGLLFDVAYEACPECGWVRAADADTRDRPAVTGGTAELGEYVEDFEYRRQFWRAIEQEREAAGFAEGWAWFRFNERFGHPPVLAEIDGQTELIDPKHATRAEREAVYVRLVGVALSKGFADGWASHKYREAFGVWPTGFVGRVRGSERERERAGAFAQRLQEARR